MTESSEEREQILREAEEGIARAREEGIESTFPRFTLDDLATKEPAEAIRWGLGEPDALHAFALLPTSEVELALLVLRDRGAKATEAESLMRAIRARRREIKAAEREAAANADPDPGKTLDDVLAEVADGWEAEEAQADDLATILDDVEKFCRRFVWFPLEAQPPAVALWIMASWLTHEVASFSPRLHITGPTYRCGKSRLLDVLHLLVFDSFRAILPTASVVFRALGVRPRTLLLDEMDAVYGPKGRGDEDLRAVINDGWETGSTVARNVPTSDGGYVLREFPSFAPMALTGIGRLPSTVEDRSIVIKLMRKRRSDPIERLRKRKPVVAKPAQELRARMATWALRRRRELLEAEPKLPDELDDRAQDAWELLLALADLAGGRWPELARDVAVDLTDARDPAEEEVDGATLLRDLFEVYQLLNFPESLTTVTVIKRLIDTGESIWAALDGGAPSARQIARLLKPYGVEPKQTNLDGNRRGYFLRDLTGPWSRYLDLVVDLTDGGARNGSSGTHKVFSGTTPHLSAYPLRSRSGAISTSAVDEAKSASDQHLSTQADTTPQPLEKALGVPLPDPPPDTERELW